MPYLATYSLKKMEKIDEKLIEILSEGEVNYEKMNALISKRELYLQSIKKAKSFSDKNNWSVAIKRTEYICSLLKAHHELATKLSQSLLKRRKVAQTYKKFE